MLNYKQGQRSDECRSTRTGPTCACLLGRLCPSPGAAPQVLGDQKVFLQYLWGGITKKCGVGDQKVLLQNLWDKKDNARMVRVGGESDTGRVGWVSFRTYGTIGAG